MYLYNFGPRIQTLGQGGPLVSVVGGVQQVSAEGAKLLQQLFTNRYPQISGSWTAATGATAPAFDPNADLWGYIASQTPSPGTPQTVYDQLQSMPDKSLFLIDQQSSQAAIAGQPVDVVYAIAKNQNIVNVVARAGASYARLLPVGGAAAQPTAPAPKKAASAAPIVAGLSLAALIAILAASA